ncbi:MAG: acylphosphatase [Gemmatimonadales bacterium]|nr:MAG: acylphosphatase [Gemmatimonadales bacterium]
MWQVRGRVQGVGFRWSARNEARRLGLAGWVRNEEDGSVLAVARGGAEALEAFSTWLADGPPAARVEGVERLDPADLDEEFPRHELGIDPQADFLIRH